MYKERYCRAYTLLELLICLLIIGLIFSLSAGSMSMVNSARSKAQLGEIRSLINFARGSAVNGQGAVTLCATDSMGICQANWTGNWPTVFLDSNSDRALSNGEDVLRQLARIPDSTEITWRAALGRRYLEFKSDGTTAQNGTLRLCPKQSTSVSAIIVNRGGRNYLGLDRNNDGIAEDSQGRNVTC